MGNHQIELYRKYQHLFFLEEDHVTSAFEEFLSNDAGCDVLEFSCKYRWADGSYTRNPERFSIWKYKFDPSRGQAFWNAGLRCFEKIARNTKAAAQLHRFSSLGFHTDLELRYVAFGVEASPEFAKTRLKIYTGYAAANESRERSISRSELSLEGQWKTDQYDGTRINNIALPPNLFACSYVQGDRLHLKLHTAAAQDKLMPFLGPMLPDPQPVIEDCERLLNNGFCFWVLTLRKSEMQQNKLHHFTIYFRGKDV